MIVAVWSEGSKWVSLLFVENVNNAGAVIICEPRAWHCARYMGKCDFSVMNFFSSAGSAGGNTILFSVKSIMR